MKQYQLGCRTNSPRIARAAILVLSVAAAGFLGIAPSAAQQQVGAGAGRLRMEAPIGHRQPRPSDLPPKVLQREKRLPPDQNGFDLDSQINICAAC